MTVVSLDMAYRSFRGGSGRLRHPPRYAAFNQTSSPRFRLSSDGSVVSFPRCMNDPQAEGHMASYIARRKFLATLGGAAAWPLAARAQQSDRVRRIGVLMGYAESDSDAQSWYAAFREELQKLGWTEGRNT